MLSIYPVIDFLLLSLLPQASHISSEYFYDHRFPMLTCSVVLTKNSDVKESKSMHVYKRALLGI